MSAYDAFIAKIHELTTENAKLRAENDVIRGSWCNGNRSEGRGGCGMCAVCCKEAKERADCAEMDAAKLRAERDNALAGVPHPERLPELLAAMREEADAMKRCDEGPPAFAEGEDERLHHTLKNRLLDATIVRIQAYRALMGWQT